jgi:hypothetical protein
MIDRARLLDQQLAERYVANQLNADETQEFEQAMLEHPEVVEQVELVRTVKLGLATLRSRGDLDALVKASPSRIRTWMAVAAAASLGAIGFAWFMTRSPPAMLAPSLSGLRVDASAVLGEFQIVRTRGAEMPRIEISQTQPVIALRLFTPSYKANEQLHAELLHGSRKLATVVATQANDYLLLYLDTSAVEPGDYELQVCPNDCMNSPQIFHFQLAPDHR